MVSSSCWTASQGTSMGKGDRGVVDVDNGWLFISEHSSY